MLGLEIHVVDTEFPYRALVVFVGLIAATLFADTVSDSQSQSQRS